VGGNKNFGFQIFDYTKHMLEKADERDIALELVEQTIEYRERIAEYSDDKPYKSYLYLSIFNHKPLHVCFAIVNAKECKVITAYEPSLIIFEEDFKTRRKK